MQQGLVQDCYQLNQPSRDCWRGVPGGLEAPGAAAVGYQVCSVTRQTG